jgi:hypothetical protein
MIRVWTWTCASITLFFVAACGMAFAHLYINLNISGQDQVAEPGFMTRIGFFVGERFFEFAERQPGLDYAVILNHPVMLAAGLLVAHLGVGSGVWLAGLAIFRVVGGSLCRRNERSADARGNRR